MTVLQQLAQQTSAQTWVIASMLFFLAVFTLVVLRVLRTPAAEHRAHAQLPLEDTGSDREPDQAAQR